MALIDVGIATIGCVPHLGCAIIATRNDALSIRGPGYRKHIVGLAAIGVEPRPQGVRQGRGRGWACRSRGLRCWGTRGHQGRLAPACQGEAFQATEGSAPVSPLPGAQVVKRAHRVLWYPL